MLGPRGYLFHCHGAPLRSVPLPRHIRGQQSADLVHEFFQFPILSEGKAFILLADERQRTVDLRKLLRLKKGVFLNKSAAHGEIAFGGFIVVLKIMSVMDASWSKSHSQVTNCTPRSVGWPASTALPKSARTR